MYDLRSQKPVNQTRRPISPGAEELLWVRFPVLDLHGVVMPTDYWGSDEAIEEAARLSYQGHGVKRSIVETRNLLRYLMRHLHTSPFEQAGLKLSLYVPEIVLRQIVRHRTASLNVESARYSEMRPNVYIPEADQIRAQSTSNKQGRGDQLPDEVVQQALAYLVEGAELSFARYHEMLDDGVARELARLGLTMGTYVELSWQMNLHNLLHFLALRMDEHTQWETRQFANQIGEIVAKAFPLTWEAFVDYRLEAKQLSRLEMAAMSEVMPTQTLTAWYQAAINQGLTNNRERLEFLTKVQQMGRLEPVTEGVFRMVQKAAWLHEPRSDKALESEIRGLKAAGLLIE